MLPPSGAVPPSRLPQPRRDARLGLLSSGSLKVTGHCAAGQADSPPRPLLWPIWQVAEDQLGQPRPRAQAQRPHSKHHARAPSAQTSNPPSSRFLGPPLLPTTLLASMLTCAMSPPLLPRGNPPPPHTHSPPLRALRASRHHAAHRRHEGRPAEGSAGQPTHAPHHCATDPRNAPPRLCSLPPETLFSLSFWDVTLPALPCCPHRPPRL